MIEASGREHESMSDCHYQTNGKKHTEFLPLPQSASNSQALINYIEAYQYDQAGNLTRTEHKSQLSAGTQTRIRNQSYANQSNRIIKSNAGCTNEDKNLSHDANGNLSKLAHLPEMKWDYNNQLIEVQLNVGANPNRVYYQYGGSGQRIRKTVVRNGGADISERIYLGDYEIYTETTNTGPQRRRESVHISDDQARIAIVESETDLQNIANAPNTLKRFQLSNHLGSATQELDKNGQRISYEEYYPYGGSAYMAGRNQVEVSLKRYRYSGKERDDETGLYYYGARYYAAWMRRWVSCDPLQTSNNIYAGFLNNPIKFVDPSGMEDEHANEIHGTPPKEQSGISTLESETARRKRLGLPSSSGKATTKKDLVNTLTYGGLTAGFVPYIGDYVSLGASVGVFALTPSINSGVDVVLDGIGALLPIVPALGTIKRLDKGSEYLELSDDLVTLKHGTDKGGSIMENGFDVSKSGYSNHDLSSGSYFTDSSLVSVDYGIARGKSRGRRTYFDEVEVSIKGSHLGKIVDIRPGGKHRKLWDDFLARKREVMGGRTSREIIKGPGDGRALMFDDFLKSEKLTDAQTVIAKLDHNLWPGIGTKHGANQIVIRDQAVADKLFNYTLKTYAKTD